MTTVAHAYGTRLGRLFHLGERVGFRYQPPGEARTFPDAPPQAKQLHRGFARCHLGLLASAGIGSGAVVLHLTTKVWPAIETVSVLANALFLVVAGLAHWSMLSSRMFPRVGELFHDPVAALGPYGIPIGLLVGTMSLCFPASVRILGTILVGLCFAGAGVATWLHWARIRSEVGAGQQRLADWWRREQQWNQDEARRMSSATEWRAVGIPTEVGRVDIFGGGADRAFGWEALLTLYGASAIASNPPVVVLDLTGRQLANELCLLARGFGLRVDRQSLPTGRRTSTLTHGLSADQMTTMIVEAAYGADGGGHLDRLKADRIVREICSILAPDLRPARIREALHVVSGSGRSELVGAAEADRLEAMLHDVFVRDAQPLISTIEAVLHPLRDMGVDAAGTPDVDLHSVIIDTRDGTNALTDLLTNLAVQWAALRAAGTVGLRPAQTVLVVGADVLPPRHLRHLSDVCGNLPSTRLFCMFRDLKAEHLGSAGVVGLMKLTNPAQAETAATFIGREYQFKMSSKTQQVGGSQTHTTGTTQSWSESESVGTSTTTTSGTTHSSGHSSGTSRTGLLDPVTRNEGTNTTTGTSESTSHGHSTSHTSTHGGARSESTALGRSWGRSETANRVHEFVIEPERIQQLPDYALLVVGHGGGTRVMDLVDCDPDLALDERADLVPIAMSTPRIRVKPEPEAAPTHEPGYPPPPLGPYGTYPYPPPVPGHGGPPNAQPPPNAYGYVDPDGPPFPYGR